ncbi:transglutaminase family protein [Gluconobacter kanchanaburiensis]|uniref:Transglutaminase-like domain-containing protein n=1 Tax=Gluconobacter kanchanaburiensis NBRC 103587 TaxID=1307948 RepID=A0A511B9M4_9PROT|nr:transglutaminase family protein [Gluconobacter kanchanaburiensis]MBF0862457.1 transglutaminase family protein [Gluconobacter kanchanaburiensis]GBR68605.1 transglutaminase-like protein [Gluconobacter kanchanaburiensis NBRC 103587]GEK96421.1 hypothetical protein GKA01_16180 [Gluconobacter kanchanaburiensis NBRC 103587]
MNSRVVLSHATRYQYDRPVHLGRQTIRLCPVTQLRSVRGYALDVSPEDADILWRQDRYGNRVAEIQVTERVTHFDVYVKMEVDLAAIPENALKFGVQLERPLCTAYGAIDSAGTQVRRFVEAWRPAGQKNTFAALMALNREVARRLTYQRRLEPGVWTPDETLDRASGSCRDSAWLLVTVLRHLGHPARFVSGYLIQPDPEGALDCELHAWAEAWIPEQGWVGFDTTSGRMVGQNHIPLAVAARPEEAAPVSGLLDRCRSTLDVTMRVEPLGSDQGTAQGGAGLALIGKAGVMRSHEAL